MTTERPATNQQETITEAETTEQIAEVCNQVVDLRQRPLLVLYYPGPYGEMDEKDVRDCYQAIRASGVTLEQPLQACDVLLHTFGGNPLAGYRLGQIIRDFSREASFLVPERAYSAGTLLCLAGNQIRLGHYAGLSPIDITQEEVELTSIDYFLEFAGDCEKDIRTKLEIDEGATQTLVASDLLCQLVQEVGALKVGEYYRARRLTGHYAQELLDSYMLANLPNRIGRRNRIIRELLFGAPAHQFHLDFHMCQNIGLIVEEMFTNESDATKQVISLLDTLTQNDIICQNIDDDVKMPFIAFYPQTAGGGSDEH